MERAKSFAHEILAAGFFLFPFPCKQKSGLFLILLIGTIVFNLTDMIVPIVFQLLTAIFLLLPIIPPIRRNFTSVFLKSPSNSRYHEFC